MSAGRRRHEYCRRSRKGSAVFLWAALAAFSFSEADAGIAISSGAAIAREIADITIASEDLFELVTLRRISEALMARIHRNYRTIVGFNLGLIIFGVAGILPPTTSALLHNASTLAISLKSMANLLPAAAV